MSERTAPIIAKKSYKDGHVALAIRLRSGGWGDSVKIEGSAELTSEQARALAHSLTELADASDAKVAAKAASEDRRRKWRYREIAAGRMVQMSAREFLNGR